MPLARLDADDDFEGWRIAARAAAIAGVQPDAVHWQVGDEASDLFAGATDPPLPNPYGPIEGGSGKPGWTLLPLRKDGKNFVKVLVPSRFADWLAGQPPARRRLYSQPPRFTLQISWG